MTHHLTIALAKGRMQREALQMLAGTGLRFDAGADSRRLSLTDESESVRFVFVKPADVPVYVEHGVADCGVTGRDVLLESHADVMQPLDLRFAQCRLVVAGGRHFKVTNERGALRVATKYPRIAAEHFAGRGVSAEIIELAGSIELAPVLGLADCIVDLVETGRTLAENNLREIETIHESSARFVVNRASRQLKADALRRLIHALEVQIGESINRD